MTTETLAYRHGARVSNQALYIAQGIARQYTAYALRAFWNGYRKTDYVK